MKNRTDIKLNALYKISDNLVSKDIEGELVIVPLVSGIGDLNTELYSLNDTGLSIWNKLDGVTTIHTIIHDLSIDFDTPYEKIQKDVIDLIKELLQKGLIVEA